MFRSLLLILMLALLGGCNGPIKGLYPPSGSDAREIYVVDNHWHTGLVLRCSEMSPGLKKLLTRFDNAEYVEIGWGDDHFYRSPNSTSGLAMGALFASQGSVLHVIPLDSSISLHYVDYRTDLYRIRISSEGERRLVQFIEESFATDESGSAIELQPGWALNSWFYRARGKYSLFHTCNQWAADALRTTGFPISPFYASFSSNVGWQIRTMGAKYQSGLFVLHDGTVPREGS